jgi:hypothetical protein
LLKYGLDGRAGTETSSVGIEEEEEEDVPRASRSIAEAFVPSGGIFMVDEKDCDNKNLILFLLKARLSAG